MVVMQGRGKLIRGRDGNAFLTRKSHESCERCRCGGEIRGGRRNLPLEMYRFLCNLMDLTLCCTSIPVLHSFSSGSKFKAIQKSGAIASKLENPNSRLPQENSGFIKPLTLRSPFSGQLRFR